MASTAKEKKSKISVSAQLILDVPAEDKCVNAEVRITGAHNGSSPCIGDNQAVRAREFLL